MSKNKIQHTLLLSRTRNKDYCSGEWNGSQSQKYDCNHDHIPSFTSVSLLLQQEWMQLIDSSFQAIMDGTNGASQCMHWKRGLRFLVPMRKMKPFIVTFITQGITNVRVFTLQLDNNGKLWKEGIKISSRYFSYIVVQALVRSFSVN